MGAKKERRMQGKERIQQRIEYSSKRSVALYIILRLLVIAVMILEIFQKNYANVFTCALTLLLFLIPAIVDKKLNIKLPTAMECIILLFIFAAEILGEIQGFYLIFPYWDTILHTMNGFLMAAIGFAMIDILNQSPRFHINLSPVFVAFVAFCFSMTIGVLWEFFEYSADRFVNTDMQKDAICQTVSSVDLNPDGVNTPVVVKDIQKTTISGTVNGKEQEIVIDGGYLDVGLQDTMDDLLVNLIGAAVFSTIGAIYIRNRGKGKLIPSLIPRMKTPAEIAETRKQQENEKESNTDSPKV